MILSLPGVKPKTETSFLQWGRSEAAQREAFQELQPASSTIYHHGFFPKLPDRGLQLSNRLDPSLFCDQSCSISCSSPCNWFFFWPVPSSERLCFGYITATWPHNPSTTWSEMYHFSFPLSWWVSKFYIQITKKAGLGSLRQRLSADTRGFQDVG